MRFYWEDLAYIHDLGFSDYALGATPGILRILRSHGISRGLVVDLGCGSGRWARELNRAGYDVLGIDQSPSMIRLARKRAPRSRFKVASLWNTSLPPCDAITSMGECLNYCFDRENQQGLSDLFRRAYAALRPGGLLICDFAGRDRRPGKKGREHRSSGRRWSLVSRSTAHGQRRVRRHIVAYLRVGNHWLRSEEVHDLRLHPVGEIRMHLNRCGFRVHLVKGYGKFRLPRGIHAVVAIKPKACAD
ncbi:MAG: class I SAM-dependent methyltransferase [Candidatus Acidiferrales bacterium]